MGYFLRRLYWRCIWSWAGTRDAWIHEHSFRSWVWANLVSAAAALWLLEGGERALILALGVLVLAAEALNTGLECVVDLVSEEKSELARRAKDAGSAGVALTAIAAGLAWLAVLFGYAERRGGLARSGRRPRQSPPALGLGLHRPDPALRRRR